MWLEQASLCVVRGLASKEGFLVTVMILNSMPTAPQRFWVLTCCPKRMSVGERVSLCYQPHGCLWVCTRPVVNTGHQTPARGNRGQRGQASPTCLQWWSGWAPGSVQGLRNEPRHTYISRWEMT